MHVEGVRGAPKAVDIPDCGIVDANFEGRVVGVDAAVEGVEERGSGGRELVGGREVGVLGSPDGFVGIALAEGELREDVGTGVVDSMALGIDRGHERFGLVEVGVQEREFAVGSHGRVHLAARVDDGGANEAGVEIFLHGDEGVVPPHVARLLSGRRRAFVDKPLVDGAL